MNGLHAYFLAHRAAVLALMWVFFALALTYMLLCLLAFPAWPFWLGLIPAGLCLYFRLTYTKASGGAR